MIAFSADCIGGTTFQFGEIDDKGNITPNSHNEFMFIN